MATKYGVTVTQSGAQFVARVVRRRTSRGTTVEKEATFEDRPSAEQWGASALAEYLESRRVARQKQKTTQTKRRKGHRESQAWLSDQTFQGLADHITQHGPRASLAQKELKERAELLWQEVGFRALKSGMEESAAISLANQDVGRNWAERLAKSRSGDLDRISAAVTEAAVKNAKAIRDAATSILQEGPSRFIN
jgi:hypothetical protein